MSAGRRPSAGSRCLQVAPRSRGGWVVMSGEEVVLSEHVTATDAELAARADLSEGDELVVYDCYHRCHSARRVANGPHMALPDARLALASYS
jgi:hypothetical protein